MRSSIILAPLVLGLFLAAPASAGITPSGVAGTPAIDSKEASVVELGKITPNDPYQLWDAINDVLLDYALLQGGEELKSQVAGVYAGQIDGKTPADVMTQTVEFRVALDQLLDRLKLAKVHIYVDPLGRDVTPGVVYVNAGYIMDRIIFALHTASDRQDKPLGDLYDVPAATGKTPSDVFGLVSLATRRLQLITAS